jgi:ribose transport system substrate-binding protein
MVGGTNRRDFIKYSALAGGTLLAGAASGREATQDETLETVLSIPSLEFTFFVRMQDAFESAQEELNVTGSVLDGQNSQERQISQIEDAVTEEVDFIMISPITSEGAVPAVRAANDADIPVVTIDRDVAEGEIVTNVASDNVSLGQRSNELLLEFMQQQEEKDTYNIVELQGTPGASVTNERSEGLERALEENDSLEVLGSQTGEFQTAEALTVMEDFITRFGQDIDGVYAQNDLMALGAFQAAQAGDATDLPIAGIDGTEAWVETFEDNPFHGTIAQLPEDMVREAIAAGRSAVEGEDVEDFIPIDGLRVTQDNAQDYLQEFFGEGGETATPEATTTESS